jgi:hypothetical protein
MTKDQILNKVAELIGMKFSTTPTAVKFAEVELEGGYTITNQKDNDFVVGDVIYLVNEDGTFSIVGAGTWTFLDGEKIFTTDEEGTLTEIKEGKDDIETPEELAAEETEVEMAEGIEIEVEPKEEDKDTKIVDAIIEALMPMMEEMKKVQEQMNELKKDYETFKKQGTHAPLKNDTIVSNNFSTDERYEMLKALKQHRRNN